MSHINYSHDPEGVVHDGLLPGGPLGSDALGDVVPGDGAVPQHVPVVVNHHRGVVARVVPTAGLREEGVRDQGAHQGPEADEEVKRLQKEADETAEAVIDDDDDDDDDDEDDDDDTFDL